MQIETSYVDAAGCERKVMHVRCGTRRRQRLPRNPVLLSDIFQLSNRRYVGQATWLVTAFVVAFQRSTPHRTRPGNRRWNSTIMQASGQA